MSTERRSTARVTAGMAVAILLLQGMFLAGRPAVADPESEVQAARERLRAIEQRIQVARAQGEALRSQLVGLFERIDALAGEIEAVHAQVVRAMARIAALSDEIATRQAALDRRAADAFMAAPSSVEILIGASSLGELQDALEFLAISSQADTDLIAALTNGRTELTRRQEQLERLEDRLRGTRERLEREAGTLAERMAASREILDQLDRDRAEARALIRKLNQARLRQEAAPSPRPTPTPSPSPTPQPTEIASPVEVRAMIRAHFEPLGPETVDIALCVAAAESGFNPLAENPANGAAGVFQFLPPTWTVLSEAAGMEGASVFDAQANVAVAAWTVAQYGWSPWKTTASACAEEA